MPEPLYNDFWDTLYIILTYRQECIKLREYQYHAARTLIYSGLCHGKYKIKYFNILKTSRITLNGHFTVTEQFCAFTYSFPIKIR